MISPRVYWLVVMTIVCLSRNVHKRTGVLLASSRARASWLRIIWSVKVVLACSELVETAPIFVLAGKNGAKSPAIFGSQASMPAKPSS